MSGAPAHSAPIPRFGRVVERIRGLALAGLTRMFDPGRNLFVFRLRRTAAGVASEGWSHRYTAISLIGLAAEDEVVARTVLAGRSPIEVCRGLLRHTAGLGLGDVALALWAARSLGMTPPAAATARLIELSSGTPVPTVELAWALAALCADTGVSAGTARSAAALRLREALTPAGIFPHVLGAGGARSHVACFADQVYPIHALSLRHRLDGDPRALQAARFCADRICAAQGAAGQWWWHYDNRTGAVIEGYPVYAVHQDSMAPLALFALQQAAGAEPYATHVERGLAWLERAPELRDGSLIDEAAGLIWRKVARREPGKLSRYLQAAASRIHHSSRVPGIDRVFPPVAIDYEDRPYHLGWVLHAFPARRPAWG